MRDHQRQAAAVARRISAHHQGCRTCQRGGTVTYGPAGARRVRCEAERRLFAALAAEQEAGWPSST